MGALAMPFETLPLGFRFKPTDVELIDHYLRLKINGKDDDVACIKEVDICRVEPWDLPDLSAIKTNDHEWFFFCPRDRKYPNGHRSNRATEAGYWKATGKDRTIKSRKMGIIGMKKTLVFYTGRAPKGHRTNWVIHEYRATLDELDGSHPGQGAFVLCRLFKKADDIKQDDNDEISHSDELEANVPSPNPTNISHEDVRSEPAVVQDSPVSVEQSVEQQVGSEHRVVKTSDSITSETIYSDHPQVNEEMTHEVDSHFKEYFYDPPEHYFKWQSMANPEPVGMQDIFPTDIGDGHNGFHLQDINGNRDPISDFLDSVINPDVSVRKEAGHQGFQLVDSDMWKNSSIKETGSCSGSDVEVVQQQHDHKDLIQNHSLADDADIFCDDYLMRFVDLPDAVDTTFCNPPHVDNFVKTEDGQLVGYNGIKIRSQDRGRQLPPSTVPIQGVAPRRIRLLTFEDEGKDSYSVVTDRSCSTTAFNESDSPELDSSSVITPAEDFFCLEDLDNLIAPTEEGKNLNTNEVVETGIKIRTHQQRSHPTPAKSVEQGTARRRIRLLKNTEDVDEKPCADNPDDYKNSSSFKSPVSVHIIKIVTVVFLFVASIGLLIARGDFLLSS